MEVGVGVGLELVPIRVRETEGGVVDFGSLVHHTTLDVVR